MNPLLQLREDRAEAIRSLDRDAQALNLQTKHFDAMGSAADAPIIVAIDWSEVLPFIEVLEVAKPLSSGDGDENVSLINGAHQAALSSLFRRFPSRLLVLPPYQNELAGYVAYCRFITKVVNHDSRSARRIISDASRTDKRLRIVLDAAMSRLPSENETNADFQEAWRSLEAEAKTGANSDLGSWLGTHFAPFYLYLRQLHVEALGTLYDLLTPHGRIPSKLMSITDCFTESSNDVPLPMRISEESVLFWESELRAVDPRKNDRVRLNDAVALSYLQLLNPLLHARRQKLFFVTRSNDIRTVMQSFPGSFGDLHESEGWAETAPTIARTWLYFMELEDLKLNEEGLSRRLEDRMQHIRRQEGGSVDAQLGQIQSELSNVQAMDATASEDLRAADATRTERLLIALFQMAGNPEEFVEEKLKIRRGIRDKIDNLSQIVELPDLFVRFLGNDPRFKSIFLSILEKLPRGTFLGDAPALAAGPLNKMFNFVLGLTNSSELAKWDHQLTSSSLEAAGLTAEQLRVEATWQYCMGRDAMRIIERTLERVSSEDLFAWAHVKLMETDFLLGSGRLAQADRVLQEIADEVRPATGNAGQLRAQLAFAVASARLLLYTDEAEYRHSISTDLTLIADRHGEPLLSVRRQGMWNCYLQHREAVRELPLLELAGLNNYLYSGCQLARAREVGENLRSPVYQEIVEIIQAVGGKHGLFTPSIYDSLAYYCMQASLQTVVGTEEMLDSAESWLTLASDGLPLDGEKLRMGRVIKNHRDELEEIRLHRSLLFARPTLIPPTERAIAPWKRYYECLLLADLKAPIRLLREPEWEAVTSAIFDCLRQADVKLSPIDVEAAIAGNALKDLGYAKSIRQVLYQLWRSGCIRYDHPCYVMRQDIETVEQLRSRNTRYLIRLLGEESRQSSFFHVQAAAQVFYGDAPSPKYIAEIAAIVEEMAHK